MKMDTKTGIRVKKLYDLGLRYNGSEYAYQDINFHWTDITCMSDEEFEKALKGATARMEILKIEESVLNGTSEMKPKGMLDDLKKGIKQELNDD